MKEYIILLRGDDGTKSFAKSDESHLRDMVQKYNALYDFVEVYECKIMEFYDNVSE